MNLSHKIVIAGAGGIGRAVGLIMAEGSETPPQLFIGDRHLPMAEEAARWIKGGSTHEVRIEPFRLPETGINDTTLRVLKGADVLLDCLPGSEAPRMAGLAYQYDLHYANLTEHVEETVAITKIAEGASRGFLLQTGLAPGFVNVLAHGLFQQFCDAYEVNSADRITMRTGALTRHAAAPHYYGFTWSPVGVATEYLKETICIREGERTAVPPLSEREHLLIEGRAFEADLTSGGAADLPTALAGKVRQLDYKSLRYPGHYDWVAGQLESLLPGEDPVATLERHMRLHIPHVEDDLVVIYAAVEGADARGMRRRKEKAFFIEPRKVGRHWLRAIQTTTAAALAESARLLLTGAHQGVVMQSRLDPDTFLNGRFIKAVYGEWSG